MFKTGLNTCSDMPQESSLAGLMHLSQREATADVVNSALLSAAAAKNGGPQSVNSAGRVPKPQVRARVLIAR